MGYELGVYHCPVVAVSAVSKGHPGIGLFHHSLELAHASLGFVDVLLILFIEIPIFTVVRDMLIVFPLFSSETGTV